MRNLLYIQEFKLNVSFLLSVIRILAIKLNAIFIYHKYIIFLLIYYLYILFIFYIANWIINVAINLLHLKLFMSCEISSKCFLSSCFLDFLILLKVICIQIFFSAVCILIFVVFNVSFYLHLIVFGFFSLSCLSIFLGLKYL